MDALLDQNKIKEAKENRERLKPTMKITILCGKQDAICKDLDEISYWTDHDSSTGATGLINSIHTMKFIARPGKNHYVCMADVGVYKEAMHCLSRHSAISDIMGKAADLYDFNKGQIITARRLGKSISEMVRLVGCSCAVVVSTYPKWCMDGEMTSFWPAVCRRWHTDSKRQQRLLCIVWRDQRATTTEITTSYNSGDPDSISQHIVQHTLPHMGYAARSQRHSCTDSTSLPAASAMDQETSELDIRRIKESCMF
ncbi:hypothetical protein X975_11519, partial [Stegodyphus mimosarum]